MKISAILTAMLLALSLQITPVFADSDKDKDSHEHHYSKDKDHHDKDGAKDKDRGYRSDSRGGAHSAEPAGDGGAVGGFLRDIWPF